MAHPPPTSSWHALWRTLHHGRQALATSWATSRATSWAASSCLVCGRWQTQCVCAHCLSLYGPHAARCKRCGIALSRTNQAPHEPALCWRCVDFPLEMDQAVVAVDFAAPWSRLVTQLKFRATPAVAQPMGAMLAAAVRAQGGPLPDTIVPVPLSEARRHERGYNQAWTLAQHAARALGWDKRLAHDILLRKRHTQRVMSLHADERARQIHGAFAVAPDKTHQIAGQHVVIVDDVLTTGATANEATRTLWRAGAASVTGWFFARTPAPDTHKLKHLVS